MHFAACGGNQAGARDQQVSAGDEPRQSIRIDIQIAITIIMIFSVRQTPPSQSSLRHSLDMSPCLFIGVDQFCPKPAMGISDDRSQKGVEMGDASAHQRMRYRVKWFDAVKCFGPLEDREKTLSGF